MLTITAPSRLHFGLWSLGRYAGRQFGGVGVMIDSPSLKLVLEESEDFYITGPAAPRAIQFAHRWAAFHQRALPSCMLEIIEAAPEHAGLGSGTQLALGVAAALSHVAGLPEQAPQELALSVGRGQRSAVGTFGFAFGGLIVEQGKHPDEAVSPLEVRLDLPLDWRFVLARPLEQIGLSGDDESLAFERLPPVPSAVTDELMSIARDELVPAAVRGDFSAFADHLYRYGRLSGECFAARQRGPYNGPVITRLVEQIRAAGYAGVGQSSWGPTVFIAMASQLDAESFANRLSAETPSPIDIVIARPANDGVLIQANSAQNVN
jgi:beta-RFAP synthase